MIILEIFVYVIGVAFMLLFTIEYEEYLKINNNNIKKIVILLLAYTSWIGFLLWIVVWTVLVTKDIIKEN